MAKIKFRNKEGGDFALVPEATYDFQITEADATATNKDGDPQLKLTLEIANEGDYLGKKIPVFLTMTEKFGWVIKQICEATGIDFEEEEDGVDENGKPVTVVSCDTDDLLQRFARANVTHYKNKQSGKTYHNVREWVESPLQTAAEGADTGSDEGNSEEPAPPPTTTRRRPRPSAG